jgi:hypothetical protein
MTKTNNGGPAFPQSDLSGYGMGPPEGPNGQYQVQGMSLRAYAAIKLRVPDSGINWLDDMIRQAKRDDFAGQALAGLMADPNVLGSAPEVANTAYRLSDAMLAERAKP